mgnify:CR=1 FL=1
MAIILASKSPRRQELMRLLAAFPAEIAAAEAELKQHRAARAAYDKKQARKRAILKSLREQAKQKASE